MKNQTRKIIAAILLMLVMSIVLHDVIPHHHHHEAEHESHLVCNDKEDHAAEDQHAHDSWCHSHGADEVETCEACHFSVEIIKEVKNQQFLFQRLNIEIEQSVFCEISYN